MAKIEFSAERTLNDLHLQFTATGNNNLSDQFRLDALPTIVHCEINCIVCPRLP